MSKDTKGNTGGTATHERTKRPKTAAQLARKAKNEQDAAARLLLLQKEQAALNAVRAEFPGQALSDNACRALIAERTARRNLDDILTADILVGGEDLGKRVMRWLGKERLKQIAGGNLAARDIITAVWNYVGTQDAVLKPIDE